jgi:hypothetical protein
MEETMSEENIQIEGRVQEYLPNAMQDDFETGSASYDATRLEVLAPIEFRGRQLVIFHNAPPPAGALWRKAGARLRARVDRDSLTGSDTVFADAFSGVQEVTPERR